MDKSKFLANLRASAVPLKPLQIPGWDGLVYIRAQTLGKIREILEERDSAAPTETDDSRTAFQKDPLYLARSIAKIVRDEDGALIFDAKSDAEMTELMAVLADAAPEVSRAIHDAHNEVNSPAKTEVGPEGN